MGEDELRQLRELQQSAAGSDAAAAGPVGKIVNVVKEHPRETFVAFTLVLAVFAYFLTRSMSLEDGVT